MKAKFSRHSIQFILCEKENIIRCLVIDATFCCVSIMSEMSKQRHQLISKKLRIGFIVPLICSAAAQSNMIPIDSMHLAQHSTP